MLIPSAQGFKMRRCTVLLPLLLLGCRSDYDLTTNRTLGELSLEVTTPTYGEFLGDEPVTVTGRVWPKQAHVSIEGTEVAPDEDGGFVLSLPVDYAYRIIDVEATLGDQHLRQRLPVFSGQDPRETWPGGATGRLLPAGLEKLGEGLGETIDATGWADQIAAALPSVETTWVNFAPVGITHEPTEVVLTPAEGGIDAAITLNDVSIEYELSLDWASYSTSMTIGYGQIAIGGLLAPYLDDDGIIWLELTDPLLTLDEADFSFGALEGWVIEWILDGINDWVVEPLGELLLGYVLDQYGTIEVGGPIELSTDLLGTSLEAILFDLYGDPEGLGVELGIGLGEPAPTSSLSIPTPDTSTPYAEHAHLVVALHEGLFQVMVGDMLLPYLSQDLDIAGSFGDIIGNGIKALPGGDEAPDGDGWCLSLDPGTAYVTRMQEGTSPLAVVYLPDLVVDVGVMQGSSCEDWLTASVAMELGLAVDGTALDLQLSVPEGALLYYGAEDYDEAEVIAGLGTWLESMIGLLGSFVDLDLSSILGGLGDSQLGGLLGDISPSIVGSTKLYDDNGDWTAGLYAVSIDLWE